jgi:RND family efflux transporter MFP subunit
MATRLSRWIVALVAMAGTVALAAMAAGLGAWAVAAAASEPAARIEISGMLLRLVEQVDVPARETGVLAAVHVAEGQMVEQDAAIAEIDDAEARIALHRATLEAEIARANAENTVNVRFARKSVEVAAAELQRSLETNERYPKSVSQTEIDRLRLVVEKGRLEVEQAEHESRIAALTRQVKENEQQAVEQKLKRHKIVAPLSGLVVQVHRRRGEWVKPGEVVARILRLDRLRAEGFVKTEQFRDDLAGRPVRVIVDLPGTPAAEFPGKVVFVDPEIDPVNAQVRIWAEVENRQLRLRPGMRARMVIEGKP